MVMGSAVNQLAMDAETNGSSFDGMISGSLMLPCDGYAR